MNKEVLDGLTKAIHGNNIPKSYERAIEKITGQQTAADDPSAPKLSTEDFKQKMEKFDRNVMPKPFIPTRRTSITVKIMRSYDYCHFESSTTLEGENITLAEVDEERKNVQRLCDKAVNQYKKAKELISQKVDNNHERQQLRKDVHEIKQKPESEWTLIEQAKVKTLADWDHRDKYDYLDDENDYRF